MREGYPQRNRTLAVGIAVGLLAGIYSTRVADETWLTGHTIVAYVPTCTFPAFWVWKKEEIVRKVAERTEQRMKMKRRNLAGGADEEVQLQAASEEEAVVARKV